jgi:hypothetical protein
MIRSVAFNATRSISVSVQIPLAVDPLAEGKVADAFTAALFVKDADQLLKGRAFHVHGAAGRRRRPVDRPGGNLTAATGPARAASQARRKLSVR